MALYRTIHTNFWEDAKVLDDMSINERYFMLYLLTNPHSNQVGCFEISKRQMINETGFSRTEIDELINRLENDLKVISYSEDTKEIFIKNWYKYNWNRSPKVKVCIEKEFLEIKSDEFKKIIYEMLIKIYGIDMVSIRYANGMYSLWIKEKEKEKEKEHKNNNNNKKEEKEGKEKEVASQPPTQPTTAPTLEKIILLGNTLGVDEKYCNDFFEYYDGKGWRNKNGKLVDNWEKVFKSWIERDIKDGKIKKLPGWFSVSVKKNDYTDDEVNEIEELLAEFK